MKITFKTLILASVGAALIAASPASAQTPNRSQAHRNAAPMMLEVPPGFLWQYGETRVNRVDPYGQIRGEYLKDAPTHNGNSY